MIQHTMKIEDEINQKKFKNEYQKLAINLLFTSTWINTINMQSLKPHGISWQQFNILRILKGMHPKPATVKLLTERMIDKMSNASRLVEKLKKKGLVERQACDTDRRRVDIVITDAGMKLIAKASRDLEKDMFVNMASLSENEAAQLNGLLDKLRG